MHWLVSYAVGPRWSPQEVLVSAPTRDDAETMITQMGGANVSAAPADSAMVKRAIREGQDLDAVLMRIRRRKRR